MTANRRDQLVQDTPLAVSAFSQEQLTRKGATNLADWDPPFPVDLSRIRPQDEKYWDDYRTTPKAFVSPGVARKLWGSRFGRVDGADAGAAGGVTGQLLKETLEQKQDTMPPGAPFALDPTASDIPAWALQGARLLKQSSQLGSAGARARISRGCRCPSAAASST